MTPEESKQYFAALWPNMMKDTRMLIIDYDVIRYHSLDLLRYTLFKDKDFFIHLKKPYHSLREPVEIADHVHFMMHHGDLINIFQYSDVMDQVQDVNRYEGKLQEMFQDPVARMTPTDVATRFDIVFERPDIKGVLLRYKNDPVRPTCYRKMTVYEVEHLLDGKLAVELTIQHNINAVMVSSVEIAIRIATMLVQRNHIRPMTFITGVHEYNYERKTGLRYPRMSKEIAYLTRAYQYEFGVFDPFSGLTERYKFLNSMPGGNEQ